MNEKELIPSFIKKFYFSLDRKPPLFKIMTVIMD